MTKIVKDEVSSLIKKTFNLKGGQYAAEISDFLVGNLNMEDFVQKILEDAMKVNEDISPYGETAEEFKDALMHFIN